MLATALLLATLCLGQADDLGPGKHTRRLTVDKRERSYHVHIPTKYDRTTPMPVVVVLHGAGMNGRVMEGFSGMSKKADEAGFIAVYPNGTGPAGILLTWNAGKFPADLQKNGPDDVAFIKALLDDLAKVVRVDPRRVYATGMSNGAMMSYRLAVEAPERFAAIAAVGGTMVLEKPQPKVPMPVLHIHGTEDTLVPFEGTKPGKQFLFRFLPVEESLRPWIKVNRCCETPAVAELPCKADKCKVVRKEWTGCCGDPEVVLYVVEGGGHTWPGMSFHARFLGETTYNIIANDVIWEFFQRHTR